MATGPELDAGISYDQLGITVDRCPPNGTCKTYCPKCHEERRNKSDKSLSINMADGSWKCHHCQWVSGLGQEARRLGIVKAKDLMNTPRPKPAPVPHPQPQQPAIFSDPSTVLHGWAKEWLATRKISEATAQRFGIVSSDDWQGHGRTIHIPYRNSSGEIVNIKHRILPKEWRQERGARKYLFNLSSAIEADTVVAVEGEFDVFACYESGWHAVVSSQDGAPGKDQTGKVSEVGSKGDGFLTPEARTVFDGAKRIIIATDADAEGQALGDWLVKQFGPERCYRVTWPKNVKDANQLLIEQGPEALDRALSTAKPVDLPGLITINDTREKLYSIYDNGFDYGFSTGWPDLDQFYRPMPGQVCIVTGRPSSGKSSLLLNMHVNLAHIHDWKIAMFSPEIGSPEMMAMKIIQIANDMPFLPGADERMSREELDAAIDWANERFIRIDAARTDEGGFATVTLDDIILRFEQAMMRSGFNCLVIDPWNRLHAMRPQGMSETDYILDSLNKLSRLALRNNICVWIVAHPGKGDLKDVRNEDEMPSAYSIMGCHAEGTEVLTRDGWKDHAIITEQDEVACIDPSSATWSWNRPEQVHVYRHDGLMHHWKGYGIDMMVTPNHRLLVQPAKYLGMDDEGWQFTTSEELTRHHRVTPIAMPKFDDGIIPTERDADFAEFVGWWLAEGSMAMRGATMCQLQENSELIISLMDRLGYHGKDYLHPGKPGERPMWYRRLRYNDFPELCEWLPRECGHLARNKHIPNEAWGWSVIEKERLFAGLIAGDGSMPSNGRRTMVYTTTSERLANDVMRLALELGYAVTLRSHPAVKENHHDQWIVRIGGRSIAALRKPRHRTDVPYSGYVYCLTVPGGAYITRFNGVAAFQGNSSHWYGAADSILGVQRNKFSEPKNQTTVATLKIREEGIVGDLGEAKFMFDARSRRFYCLSMAVPSGIGHNPYPPLPNRIYIPPTEIIIPNNSEFQEYSW